MNFIEGRLQPDGDRLRFGPASCRSSCRGTLVPAGCDARRLAVTLGVRPEDVVLGDDGERGDACKVVEPTGHESIVFFDLAGPHAWSAASGPTSSCSAGEAVRPRP